MVSKYDGNFNGWPICLNYLMANSEVPYAELWMMEDRWGKVSLLYQ